MDIRVAIFSFPLATCAVVIGVHLALTPMFSMSEISNRESPNSLEISAITETPEGISDSALILDRQPAEEIDSNNRLVVRRLSLMALTPFSSESSREDVNAEGQFENLRSLESQKVLKQELLHELRRSPEIIDSLLTLYPTTKNPVVKRGLSSLFANSDVPDAAVGMANRALADDVNNPDTWFELLYAVGIRRPNILERILAEHSQHTAPNHLGQTISAIRPEAV